MIFTDTSLTNYLVDEEEAFDSYLSQVDLRVSEFNEPNRNSNSALLLPILSVYTLYQR